MYGCHVPAKLGMFVGEKKWQLPYNILVISYVFGVQFYFNIFRRLAKYL